MLKAKLVVVGGDAKSAEIRLKLPTVIGRGKEANLTVPHALVSRRHTEVFEKEGRLFVRDLGSLNGTFVNNKKIEGDQQLDPNQLLTLGNVTFRAVYEAGSVKVSPDSETINFDEVKTEEVKEKKSDSQKVKLEKAGLLSKVEAEGDDDIDFTETVPVDEIANKSKDELKEKAAPVAKKEEPQDKVDGSEEVDDELEFELDEKSPSAADTDKSFKTDDPDSISDIFDFEEESSPSASVAASALEDLPSAAPAAVSFVGKVDFGEDLNAKASQVDPIEIDLGEEKKPKDEGSDPGLGSFLNKLPR